MLTTPLPAIVSLKCGGFALLTHRSDDGRVRLINPITKAQVIEPAEAAFARCSGDCILVTRRIGGAGVTPRSFGFTWFLPSIWRYRRPLANVLVASILVQIFALVTPLFFQVVIDKVLVHNARSTLIVMVIGLALISIFEVVLQYL
jgi:subfamily B ATP-binding cassette protein HlyB/CyaB